MTGGTINSLWGRAPPPFFSQACVLSVCVAPVLGLAIVRALCLKHSALLFIWA